MKRYHVATSKLLAGYCLALLAQGRGTAWWPAARSGISPRDTMAAMKDVFPRRFTLAVLFCFLSNLSAAGAPVRAWQDSIRLPTYQEAEADATPQFSAFTPEFANYPYPIRTQFTQNRQDQTWRVLNLENEYLLCRVLPELGGHLYNCRDKRNGREMFYANPVIKKVPFGMRGAWVAMGIESNFPVAHARAGMSPADFALHSESDGSARAILEDIDRVTGMQWRVEYVLRPASTVLEQRVTLYNRGQARRPYLWWANAGFALDDPGTRFVLPTRLVGDHGNAKIDTWPIAASGRDESLVAAHKDAMAWFAYGCREPFFAVYKPGTRSGVAHFADPAVVTGKKLWLWGSNQETTIRQQVTDNFPFYGEMQGGLFQNQETNEFLQPEQHRSFSEYWIPVHDVGGISRVTRDAIVNMERRAAPGAKRVLLVELSVTRPLSGAAIRLVSNGKVAFETHANLNPAARYEHVVEDPGAPAYTLQLLDAQGATLLEHTEGVYAVLAPDHLQRRNAAAATSGDRAETETALAAKARNDELKERWAGAWSGYTTGLRKFPSSIPLLKEAGILAVALHRFEDAAGLLAPVRAVAATDEVSYTYGVALAMVGRDGEATTVLSQISPSAAFGASAALQLALLAARRKDDATALTALKPLLTVTGGPVRPGAIEVALLRRSGRKDNALRQLSLWQNQDPADSMLRFEKTLLGSDEAEFWNHLAADSERVIALADDYFSMGMYEEALRLLDHSYPPLTAGQLEPGAVGPAENLLVAYYRAFCREQLHQRAADDFALAARASTRFGFPYLPGSLAVLQYAIKSNPSDANAHFLLGLFFMQGLEVDRAVAAWSKALSIDPKLPGLERELARAMQEANKDLLSGNTAVREILAPRALPKAPKSRPSSAAAPIAPTSPAPAPAAPAAAPPAVPIDSRNVVSVASAAMMAAASGKIGEAAAAFNPQLFAAEKQPNEVRRAYIEVQLHKLLASTASFERCPAVLDGIATLGEEDKSLPFTFHGFGSFIKAAHFQYYLALIEAGCRQEKSARKRLEKVSKMKESLPSAEFVFPLLAAVKIKAADAPSRIAASLQTVRAALPAADPAARPSLVYIEAMLLHMSGQNGEAIQKLQEAVGMAGNDTALQYFAQLAIREILPAK